MQQRSGCVYVVMEAVHSLKSFMNGLREELFYDYYSYSGA